MSSIKWTLPKKWEVVETELFVDKNDNRYSYTKTTTYAILTVRFYQKKYWWSEPTTFDKKIACQMHDYTRLDASYNDWFWFPEMSKFDTSAYSVELSVFGEGSYATAKRFRSCIAAIANGLHIDRNDGWEKVLKHHKELEEAARKPTFKETPSAYR
jgi:hypothetical protein